MIKFYYCNDIIWNEINSYIIVKIRRNWEFKGKITDRSGCNIQNLMSIINYSFKVILFYKREWKFVLGTETSTEYNKVIEPNPRRDDRSDLILRICMIGTQYDSESHWPLILGGINHTCIPTYRYIYKNISILILIWVKFA